jgi:hypothetical protein
LGRNLGDATEDFAGRQWSPASFAKIICPTGKSLSLSRISPHSKRAARGKIALRGQTHFMRRSKLLRILGPRDPKNFCLRKS